MKRIKTLCAVVFAMGALMGGAIASAADIPLVGYNQYCEDYTSAERCGRSIDMHEIYVISKNASLWSEPRTNSRKLATVSYGEKLHAQFDASGEWITHEDFYKVKVDGKTGWVNQAYVTHVPLEIVLMESNVPAYCAPDSSAKRVGSLSKGTRLRVLGFYHEYYVVSLRQASAFIPMDAVHYDSVFEAAYNQKHASAVTTREAALYAGPGREYAKIQTLEKGDQITVYGTYENWYVMRNYEESPETLMFIELDAARVWSDWLPER